MSISLPARRVSPARFAAVLFALALLATTLAAPTGVSAARHDHGSQDRPGEPGAGDPGSAAGSAPDDLGATADVSAGAAATTTTDLNLRAGAGTDSAVLTVIPAGAPVEITGDAVNGFYPVAYDGTSGYAAGAYLSIGGSAPEAAAPAPAADTATDPSAAAATAGVYGQNGIVAIIYAAAAAYGQSGDDMLRVAICESGLDPNNVTPPYDASGLFQFLPSTWASTPYAAQSVYDPVANANAAAWMWSVGRRGEWVCQ